MKIRLPQALCAALALGLGGPLAQAAPGNAKMPDRAIEALENTPTEWIEVIAVYKDRPGSAEKAAEATQAGKTTGRRGRAEPKTRRRSSNRQGVMEAMLKSLARSLGNSLGRSISRGVLGSILKG